jgi:hypothetical protein
MSVRTESRIVDEIDFVHTGPETLAGRYLRMFWQPIYVSAELKSGYAAFGGKKGLAEIEASFAKRFGIDAKIRFSAGPEMNAMAARVVSEYKSGGRASTGIYFGSLGQYAQLVRENALEEGIGQRSFVPFASSQ